ncbi:unnamed protein product [marine sediment metagenome]|uniref:Uncharacterized protein n=1 Tax=marine sediment metagenome TaxID=412755 RepID=X1MEL1_9ZZZZ
MGFKFINLWQSKEERQEKYHLARSLGVNSYWASVMRDWRLAKIERLFGLTKAPVDPQQPGLSVLLSRGVDGIGGKKDLHALDFDLRGSNNDLD